MSHHEPESCRTITPRLVRFVGGLLPEGEESAVRDHLVSCPACRRLAAGRDPSILFLELRGRKLPDSFWAGFPERLRAGLGPARFRWGDLFRYPRLAYLTAPAAMALILVVALLVADPTRIERPGRAGRQGTGAGPGSGGPGQIAGLLDPGGPAAPLAAPMLEEVDSPGARVYRFDLGAESNPTAIFMVFDESIDI